MPRASVEAIEVLGVRVTHPSKVLFPADGITKLDLARYYADLAPVVLRYAARRPLTLRPFMDGIDEGGFYLKNAPRGAPRWLRIFEDVAPSTGEPVRFVVAEDARTLVWLAQYNAIEVHPWLSTVERPDHPDWAIVDLDPMAGTPWAWVVQGAQAARARLKAAGLETFVKLSGSKGLHLLVPLAPEHPFPQVRAYFQALARDLVRAHPETLTLEYTTAERERRVLLDWRQNGRGRSTAAPYSVRPLPGAPVSAPITWEELEDPKLSAQRWTLRTLPERLASQGDPLEPALRLRQRLPSL